jgi:nitrogenase molybdenum-iron protein NifN
MIEQSPLIQEPPAQDYSVTINACKLCTPLGAVVAFAGIQGGMTLLHGSQGCATYIRRYLISHFREPLDVASSSFTEHSAVFGGKRQLHQALTNMCLQYSPNFIGVATTCLAETIGEDVPGMLKEWEPPQGVVPPAILWVSTASYRDTHRQGFQHGVRGMIEQLTSKPPSNSQVLDSNQTDSTIEPTNLVSVPQKDPTINIFPGMVSPADLRWLKNLMDRMRISYRMIPDYSETLDGGLWDSWKALPPGGVSVQTIRESILSYHSIDLGTVSGPTAGELLEENHGVPRTRLELPVGIGLTDRFLDELQKITGKNIPPEELAARERLADSYVDAHKYLSGVPVLIYGEEDLVRALAVWVREVGMIPKLCATGSKAPGFEQSLSQSIAQWKSLGCKALEGADFIEIEAHAKVAGVRLIIGNSKGFKLSKNHSIPLIRRGFPIHDRFGGQRIQHLGYGAAQDLFDQVVNTLLEKEQSDNPVGYTYF